MLMSRFVAVLAAIVSLSALSATGHAAGFDVKPSEPESIVSMSVTTSRIAGTNRYDTAVAISSAWAPGSATAVLVASGENFPDALAAAGLAKLMGSPVLLSRPDSLPSVTAEELRRLQPNQLYVLGGEQAVSDDVFNDLQQLTTSAGDPVVVTRIGGEDRYASAAAISTAKAGTGMRVYIARGDTYPDALSVSSVVVQRNGVMLLVRPTTIPAATKAALTRLQPSHIIVIGGEDSVSAEVFAELQAWKNPDGHADPVVSRFGGANRWETSAVVATQLGAPGNIYMTTGLNFPDALTIGPRAGRSDLGTAPGSVLLTRPERLPSPIAYHLYSRGRLPFNHPQQVIAVGGESAVSTRVLEQAAAYFP